MQAFNQRRQAHAWRLAPVEVTHGLQAGRIVEPILLHDVPGELQMRRLHPAFGLGQTTQTEKKHSVKAMLSALCLVKPASEITPALKIEMPIQRMPQYRPQNASGHACRQATHHRSDDRERPQHASAPAPCDRHQPAAQEYRHRSRCR